MTRPRIRAVLWLLVVAAAAVSLAGCGGSGGGDATSTESTSKAETTTTEETVTAPGWAGEVIAKPGAESAAVMAGSDFAVGTNRVTFLLVRDDGSLVRRKEALVTYRPDPAGPVRRTLARLVDIGVDPSKADADEVKQIYVATLELTRPGKQWIVVEPVKTDFQGFQILDVKAKPVAVAVGDRAPASRNPTLATAPANRITTARPPDVGLLKYSVADSLAAKVPFVVAFATPSFCQSRTCGPTVDVMDAVRRRFESKGIRFIHIEIYEDNLPGNGVNRWVNEWKLPTEPWVFVVDRTGVVRDRFEGAISVGELERSVRTKLLSQATGGGSASGQADPNSVTVEVQVVGARPKGGIVRPTVRKGQRVTIVVRSDTADELHLHGYDVSKPIAAGGVARLTFTASLQGRFELELEDRGIQLADITVR